MTSINWRGSNAVTLSETVGFIARAKHVVDQVQQVLARPQDLLQLRGIAFSSSACGSEVREAGQRSEASQLVTHAGENTLFARFAASA